MIFVLYNVVLIGVWLGCWYRANILIKNCFDVCFGEDQSEEDSWFFWFGLVCLIFSPIFYVSVILYSLMEGNYARVFPYFYYHENSEHIRKDILVDLQPMLTIVGQRPAFKTRQNFVAFARKRDFLLYKMAM